MAFKTASPLKVNNGFNKNEHAKTAEQKAKQEQGRQF
jgi:hypothetical protein